MGGDGRNVKSAGGIPPSGGHTDYRDEGSAYGGQVVGISPSVRRPGDIRDIYHQGIHSVAAGHYCGANCLPDNL